MCLGRGKLPRTIHPMVELLSPETRRRGGRCLECHATFTRYANAVKHYEGSHAASCAGAGARGGARPLP